MPDYLKLLARRTQNSFVPNAPPIVPNSLRQLVQRIDPAAVHGQGIDAVSQADAGVNPFYGKKILICAGEADKLVKWEYSKEFVEKLVVDPPQQGQQAGGEGAGLKVYFEPGGGHAVSEAMVEQAGEWIWRWGVSRARG